MTTHSHRKPGFMARLFGLIRAPRVIVRRESNWARACPVCWRRDPGWMRCIHCGSVLS